MGQPEQLAEAVDVDGLLAAFRSTFRDFHAAYSACADAGVDLGTLLGVLQDEGVELPDWLGMML